MDIDHHDIIEFCTTPRSELQWIKRCVNLDDQKWKDTDQRTQEVILNGIKSGDIWLNKIRYDKRGRRIRANVCQEVYLLSRGTCLLQHVNLGACRIGDIQTAFRKGMSELCSLHGRTGVGESGEYLPPDTDRQVGLGMLGLANLLRQNDVTYKEFADALEAQNDGIPGIGTAGLIASELYFGIQAAAQIARENNMERAFAIAPTASCAYRSKDREGFTCTPEIAPPIGRTVDRDSGTFGVETHEYGDVEIASEVGWDTYKKVSDNLMYMLNHTGLLHGYSFNSWSDVVTYDNNFVEEWLASPQTSLYYSLQVMGDSQDKTSVYAALDDSDVEDYLQEIINQPISCDCQE